MGPGLFILLLAVARTTLFTSAQATCLSPWVHYDNSCYLFGFQKMNWFEAVAVCKVYGGNLVEIRNEAENNWVINQLKDKHLGSIWLGGSDIFDEGSWKWITDNVPITAGTDWAHDQPDNHRGEENCLEMRAGSNYTRNDLQCHRHNNIVCEKEASLTRTDINIIRHHPLMRHLS